MNTRMICSIAGAALLTLTHPLSAQERTTPMDGKSVSYTGCIEAGTTTGSFKLTHADMAMNNDAMKKEGATTKDSMKKDAMMELSLMSKGVDLTKHVGHRVTVTGMSDKTMVKDSMGKDVPMLAVTDVKMLSATCGM